MSKKLLPIFFFLASFFFKSQVVFCPPGAEWHYNFGTGANTVANERIYYDHDSVVGSETCKVLKHARFHMSCSSYNPMLTLIKQKGDTIFFRNTFTQHTWQILYNFAVQAGQGWQTQILVSGTPSVVTNTFAINSISTVTINGLSLKKMTMGSESITERIGANLFLFRFYNSGNCDGPLIAGALCYHDNEFGTKQFTSLPCDFSGAVGLQDSSSKVKFYPNPAKDFLILEADLSDEAELKIMDLLGRELKTVKFEQNSKMDVSDLAKGIYIISVYKGTEKTYITKFIKE